MDIKEIQAGARDAAGGLRDLAERLGRNPAAALVAALAAGFAAGLLLRLLERRREEPADD